MPEAVDEYTVDSVGNECVSETVDMTNFDVLADLESKPPPMALN